MTDPRDITAATELVDYGLDRVNACDAYRALHRADLIHSEIPFARFQRRQRELEASRSIVSFARSIEELPEVVVSKRRAAA